MYCVHASLKKMFQSALVLQTVTLKNVCWVSGSRCLLHSEEPLILLLFFCLLDVCYCSKERCYNCLSDLWLCLTCYRVICKLLASKSESIRVQALKVLGYFLKHLGHKSVLLAELSWYISFVWFSAALKWGSTWYFPIILLSFTTKPPPKCCISGGRWRCATHSVGLSVWKDTAVKLQQCSLHWTLERLFVCVYTKIMPSSSCPGGIILLTVCTGREVEPWWAAVNAGGFIHPMWQPCLSLPDMRAGCHNAPEPCTVSPPPT